jgi:hypothetical protein
VGIGSWLVSRPAAAFGAASAGMGAGVRQVTGAAKNTSFLIIILGVLHFLVKIFLSGGGLNPLTFTISLLLYILAGYALANRVETNARITIFIPMLIFAVWYFYFGGNYDPSFLLKFALTTAALLLIPVVLSKGQSVKPELLGFLPALFLFLDIGMLEWLVQNVGLQVTPFLERLILWMPWWALFGLFTLPSNSSSNGTTNFLIEATRIVGILVLVLVFIAPFIENVGYESALPSAGELQEAQLDVRQRLQAVQPDSEPLFWSQLKCLTDYEDMQGCIDERQQLSEITNLCENLVAEYDTNGNGQVDDDNSGTVVSTVTNTLSGRESETEMEICIREQKEVRAEQIALTGATDSTIKEPTTAKFTVSEYFPREMYKQDGQVYRFPAELEIENPLEYKIVIAFSCTLEKSGEDDLVGVTTPAEVEVTAVKDKIAVVCEPPEGAELDGSYTIEYTAAFKDLVTKSRLKRAFIGEKDLAWKEAWLPEILKAHFSGNSHLSLSPEDFAQIIFSINLENPIIEKPEGLLVASLVKNNGQGKITAITDYEINLEGFAIQADEENCLSGGEVEVKTSGSGSQLIHLPTCFIEELPSDLEDPDTYIIREYEAAVTYDYEISKKEATKVVDISGEDD